jgi:ABC-type lipoprotein release transport system permease subunit
MALLRRAVGGGLFHYNFRSLLARPTSTISSLLLIALVIGVFAYLQAVTDSAFQTMAGTGDPNTILVLAQSADAETMSRLGNDELNRLGGVADAVQDDKGPVISPELTAISSAYTGDSGATKINTAVRGVDFERANRVRHDRVKIVEGRLFQPGTEEVIVGRAASRLYLKHGLGDRVPIGTRGNQEFTVVGIFDTGGTAADSEIWGYVETIRDAYGRCVYSSARLVVDNEQAGGRVINFVKGPGVELSAQTEKQYFASLNTNQTTTQVLGIVMIIIMGIAAAFAIANTMYAAVAGRVREIGMLRAIGFAKTSILTAFVLEGLVLAVGGGALGASASLLFNGVQRNMMPSTFTTVSYSLEITPKILGVCLAVAAAIGLAGSVFPAWRAAKMSVVQALRD